ncbi:glycosyltransferase [Streptomyces sp. HNM0663]|uniref:Glycosyltransferase n=1 Tax=Streptomyces chengmaiensis TaxID=3040919 RepID=A0ABT6HQ55_9ACTN|nr:nucleotide disphospho-sugar-binding domain-containing protein [Streptomyces chengmaiensis]MDH2390852.1 glycosyltransferase [Streptomyces chengmaiensis]
MRVLFTTWAWPSHLYAMVPLAWAFRAAGHDVLVASQPELAGLTASTGLPGVSVGADVDAVGLVRGYVLPSENGPADGAGRTPRSGKGPRAMQMFYAHADSMTDDLARLARDWRADAVVFEPTALAGPVAAAAAGVPAVRLLYGTDLMARARALLPQVLAPLAERNGVDAFDPFGALTVDPCPDDFQVPVDHPRLAMRYVPFNGPGGPPHPPLGPPGSGVQRVVVTWGHTMARLSPERFLAGQVARAIARPGLEVVLAVAKGQRALLGELPGESAGLVKVVEDTPLHLLVDDASLVVAHGGAGTVLTSLRAGVPLLLVPQLPDHLGHSGRVVATGAGEVLTRDEATDERLRAETEKLLTGDVCRAAAVKLREQMLSLPAPAGLVAEIESRVVACAA